MRGRLKWAIVRAVGFVAVAVAIVATALHFITTTGAIDAGPALPSADNPLARELARCQAIGMAAKDDAACEAAWAENRRRFFTTAPAHSRATAPAPSAKPQAR